MDIQCYAVGMIRRDSTICDACGQRYEFTNYVTDRCPICFPEQKREDDSFSDYELFDEVYDDD